MSSYELIIVYHTYPSSASSVACKPEVVDVGTRYVILHLHCNIEHLLTIVLWMLVSMRRIYALICAYCPQLYTDDASDSQKEIGTYTPNLSLDFPPQSHICISIDDIDIPSYLELEDKSGMYG